ncbi:hypothetical protein LCGC14_1507130 [marine sediment metagenome]|uniref:Uncharacterized protein n=1 Tax=marine sediment metagenome TaxID=412755 RepID=A0A0F9M3S0_9ZZZZ
MSKLIIGGPVELVRWYDSQFSDEFRFAYVRQVIATEYTSGADDTYDGKKTSFEGSRQCFTKWAIDRPIEDFEKIILKNRGAGRIISVIGCDLFSVLTEDQKSYYTNLVKSDPDSAEVLLADWSENMLKLGDEGEVLDYQGLQMFGQYFYRTDEKAEDIDHREVDYQRMKATEELEATEPDVVEDTDVGPEVLEEAVAMAAELAE